MITSANQETLNTDFVTDPRSYRLIVVLGRHSIDAVLMSRVRQNDIIHRHYDCLPGTDIAKTLQEVVYANPLLTADFYRADVVVDNNRFFVMSADEATPETTARRIEQLWPHNKQADRYVPLLTPVEKGKTVLVSAVERQLLAFVRRTWSNACVSHRLGLSAAWQCMQNRFRNIERIYAEMRGTSLDVIAIGRAGLMLANTFDIPGGVQDAAYYVLAVSRYLDFDKDADRVITAGDTDDRNALTETLRKFIPFAMPEIPHETAVALLTDNPSLPKEAVMLKLM